MIVASFGASVGVFFGQYCVSSHLERGGHHHWILPKIVGICLKHFGILPKWNCVSLIWSSTWECIFGFLTLSISHVVNFIAKKKMVHPSRNAFVKIQKHSVLRNASKQTGTLLSNMAFPLPNSLDIDTPSASFIRSLQKENEPSQSTQTNPANPNGKPIPAVPVEISAPQRSQSMS